MYHHQTHLSKALLILYFLTLAVQTDAAEIAYDGFDYPLGSDLDTASGGNGWNGQWIVPTDSSELAYDIVPGLTMQSGKGALQTTGNAVAFENTSAGFIAGAKRELSTIFSDNETVWMSYLFRLDSIDDPADVSIFLGLTDGQGIGGTGSRHVTRPIDGNLQSKGFASVGYGEPDGNPITINSIRDYPGNTYLLVAMMLLDEFGTARPASLWILDETSFGLVYDAAVAKNAGRISEDLLNTTSMRTGVSPERTPTRQQTKFPPISRMFCIKN